MKAKILNKNSVLKLNIGQLKYTQTGFICISPEKGADIKHDLEKYPYPIKDNTATVIKAVHVLERINPLNNGTIKWMDEMWRMLKYDGQLVLSVYYAGSTAFWSDPTYVNGCTHQTWFFFDPNHISRLYYEYKPKPWTIGASYANPDGLMEIILTKNHEEK